MTGVFLGCRSWQFNDWTVADGMELAAILHLHPVSTNINTDNLIPLLHRYLSMSLYDGSYGRNNECKFRIDFIL